MSISMYTSGEFLFGEEPSDEVWKEIKEVLGIDWIEEKEGHRRGNSYIARESNQGRYITFASYDHSYHGFPPTIIKDLKKFAGIIQHMNLWFTSLEEADWCYSRSDLEEEEDSNG
jgi:hypothetical protein